MMSNNQLCGIENINVNIFLQITPQSTGKFNRMASTELRDLCIAKEPIIKKSAIERESFLLDKLSQFQKIVSTTHRELVFRNLALYSAFCTLWENNNTGDLQQMELKEKDLLIAFESWLEKRESGKNV